MPRMSLLKAAAAGWIGGFLSNALLGALFSSPWIQRVLYDPHLQSDLFITLTRQRDLAVSIIGLVVLSGIHGILFSVLKPAIPGASRLGKGLWWGVILWAMYWLFQEWFVYMTLLREPAPLAALELLMLLAGSLLEGLVIARIAD